MTCYLYFWLIESVETGIFVYRFGTFFFSETKTVQESNPTYYIRTCTFLKLFIYFPKLSSVQLCCHCKCTKLFVVHYLLGKSWMLGTVVSNGNTSTNSFAVPSACTAFICCRPLHMLLLLPEMFLLLWITVDCLVGFCLDVVTIRNSSYMCSLWNPSFP